MKKILIIITTILFSVIAFAQQNNCCPKFELKQMGNIMPCHGDSTCAKDPFTGGNPGMPGPRAITACRNSAQTYYVFPNLPGFTFTWNVVGGVLTLATGNSAVITWGNGTAGSIQVIITDVSGNCRDTIFTKVCLLNSPIAAFNTAPATTVCANQTPITFTDASTGATTWSWDFGDLTGSNMQNPPPHLYTTPGTYTVLLTVTNASGGGGAQGESRCGCSDTASIVITVLSGTGPKIESSCKKMLCPGDTATYCVTSGCAPFNWTVNGGTITNNTGNCITVQWNATPPLTLPAYVSVTTGCGGICGNAAYLAVPVLWNNMPIGGPNPVCVGSAATYSLPTMPGTFYTWTVSGGGGVITGPNQNTPTITVQWNGPAGPATISCTYNNPYSGCSGSTTKPINVRDVFKINGPSPVCTGTPNIYSTVSGNANWVITPGTGFTAGTLLNTSSINVNWSIPNNYTITATPVTPANYCNPNSSVIVVVNQTPVLSNINGPNSICPGGFYTYSVTSNVSGPFVWTPSANGTIISPMGANNDSVVIQWINPGPHSLTVTQTVKGCTGTKTLSPINNVPPVTITGAANVCRDQIPNPLYNASGGLPAGSYTWSISPAAAGTITGGQGTNQISVLWSGAVIAGVSTATVSVVVCNYTPVNFTVNITTPPNVTVSKTGSLCAAGVTLSVSPSLPCYQWYLNGVAIGGATSATYVATTFGYYEVKCPTLCSGYGGIFVPREFIPNVKISANNKLGYCPGETINLNLFSAAGGGCTYQWFNSGTPIGSPSGTNSPLNVTAAGSYYQVVSCGNCKDTSNTILVYVMPVCDPAPGCDFSYLPKQFNEDYAKAGPAVNEKVFESKLLTATLNIGTPSNYCNNVQFSAIANFTSPHSLNSGIHWNFGDGGTFSTTISGGFTPAHTYSSVGVYVVSAWVNVNCPPPPTPHICTLTDTIHYVVPIAANFGSSVHCDTVMLNNLSTVLSPCTITAYAWSATGPGTVTFSNPTAANPYFTATSSGTYNVTLTVTSSCNGCTATITLPVVVNVPSATFTAPSPVCAGSPVSLSAPGGFSNYLWNFGDGFTSSAQNTTHTFDLTPPSPTISLLVSNALGCKATSSVTISVVPPPVLTITPMQKICPGASATITASGAGFTTFDFYRNGVLVQSGASNTYTSSATGTFYVIANTSSGGCAVKSALTYVFHHAKPVADIQGSSIACLNGGTASIYLYNSVNNPTSTYLWNLQGNVTPLSTQFDLSINVNAVGNYSYVITVTDSSGCIARDTFCVVVGLSPIVTVTGPSGSLCAGISHTFVATATPPNPNYIYQWSNGATGSTMSTSLPGMYMVTVTNPANGCFGSAFAGIVKPKPSTVLFPVGCDTLCDFDSIIPPLALGGPIVPGGYTVQWFLNGNYASPIYTGPVLNLLANIPPLIYGMNNISIVVTYNGCSDTSNAYNLFIKKCDSCDCKESKWDKIILTKGKTDLPIDDNPDKNTAVAKNNNPKVVITDPTAINLNCGKTFKLDCNKPYSINTNYICKDTACAGKVTYSLQPPSGLPISGTMPPAFNFTPTQNGTYVLTMYGWCGDKICDTCVVKFDVVCKECDCKGSKWVEQLLTIDNVTKPFKCDKNKAMEVKCKQPISVNATYLCADQSCNQAVTYSLQPPTGSPTTGNLPLTFTPLQSGTYTLTMYGWCGNTICDSCVVKFKTVCDPEDCCPYEIKATTGTVKYDYTQIPNATIAAQTFTINGLASANITEVRANVVSYTIDDNYKKECMKCVNLPFTWASINTATNIGTAPPKITMYGGTTVPTFTGSASDAYKNPREVVWNNGSQINIPNGTNIGINFILPPVPAIDCCELKGKICVKFTFRDNDCKECEAIVCFDFVIKKK